MKFLFSHSDVHIETDEGRHELCIRSSDGQNYENEPKKLKCVLTVGHRIIEIQYQRSFHIELKRGEQIWKLIQPIWMPYCHPVLSELEFHMMSVLCSEGELL